MGTVMLTPLDCGLMFGALKGGKDRQQPPEVDVDAIQVAHCSHQVPHYSQQVAHCSSQVANYSQQVAHCSHQSNPVNLTAVPPTHPTIIDDTEEDKPNNSSEENRDSTAAALNSGARPLVDHRKIKKIAVSLLFTTTMVMPFVKIFGTIYMILEDIKTDAKCSAHECHLAINQTGNATYLAMAFGLLGIAVAHFVIGSFICMQYPRIHIRNQLNAMKAYALFTGLELVILTCTLSTIHTTAEVAFGVVVLLGMDIMAMSIVFCYPPKQPYSRVNNSDNSVERSGSMIEMQHLENGTWRRIPRVNPQFERDSLNELAIKNETDNETN